MKAMSGNCENTTKEKRPSYNSGNGAAAIGPKDAISGRRHRVPHSRCSVSGTRFAKRTQTALLRLSLEPLRCICANCFCSAQRLSAFGRAEALAAGRTHARRDDYRQDILAQHIMGSRCRPAPGSAQSGSSGAGEALVRAAQRANGFRARAARLPTVEALQNRGHRGAGHPFVTCVSWLAISS
jgi:hypothetical protein